MEYSAILYCFRWIQRGIIMGSTVSLEGRVWENYQSFCRFYKEIKYCYDTKRFEDLPPYLIRFFEKGPNHFIRRNLNQSWSIERVRYSNRRKAYLGLTALERMFQVVVSEIATKKTCTVTFTASWHDGLPYVVKGEAILKELFLKKCAAEIECTFSFEHSIGLSETYTVTVQRIGAFPLRSLVIQCIHQNKIDVAHLPPQLLVN